MKLYSHIPAPLLAAIIAEIDAQDKRWGIQNHPSVDVELLSRPFRGDFVRMAQEYEMPSEPRAKQLCELAAKRGQLTWAHIAVEELAEVIGCMENEEARKDELVDLISVLIQWYKCIDK